jgi:cytochrome c oxidase cbb3-type subunit 3/ubiquinol-cytochrome c reductase cytochrome c subunit
MVKQKFHRLALTLVVAATGALSLAACGTPDADDPGGDAPEAIAEPAVVPPDTAPEADVAPPEEIKVVEAGLGCAAFDNDERFLPVADLIASMEEPTCEAGQNIVFVDARPQLDFEFGHIPGAISVPYFNVEAYADELPKDAWLVIYCECPHAEAVQAADALTGKFGFTQVKVIDEGLAGWRDLGRPIEAKSAESSESEG